MCNCGNKRKALYGSADGVSDAEVVFRYTGNSYLNIRMSGGGVYRFSTVQRELKVKAGDTMAVQRFRELVQG